MGKKTIGKRGQEREKHGDKKPIDWEEVSHGKNESSAEDDAEFHNEDEEKNEHRHEARGNYVEFKATESEAVFEGGVSVDNNNKKKKNKKKRHEVSVDDVELSDNENEGVMKDDVGGDKKKKKNKQRHEIGGNGVELSAYQIETVIESNVKDKRKKENKKLQGVGGDNVKFDANQSEAMIESDVHVDKKKKSNKSGVSGNSFEFGASQSEVVIESDINTNNNENEKDKEKKKKKKKKKKRKIKEVLKGQVSPKEEDVAEMMDGKEGDQKKEKKQLKRNKEGSDVTVMNNVIDGEERRERLQLDKPVFENVENSRKEKKRKKKNHSDDVWAEKFGNVNSGVEDNEGHRHSGTNDEGSRNREGHVVEDDKKKKAKSGKNRLEGGAEKVPRIRKDVSSQSSKKVSFSDQVEVFPSCDGSSDAKDAKDDGLVRGKRFSQEEDEKIKNAVTSYIEAHKLGEEGLNMVLHCRSHPEVKNCWKEIGAALPWRPSESIYYRAHILFERDENRKWTPEELDFVKKFHEKHGSDWKKLAGVLGKHRFHVKDTWRRIRLPNLKKGKWSQEEYQKLFDLVNMDLRMKASEEKKPKHGMLRDNISWEAISDKLSTRSNAICCMKWYDQLTSPMVAEGKWYDTDDYLLVNALSSLDACHMDDVDWDNLLEHRSGSICRKRWNQMVKHIGPHGNSSFSEQVEILSTRYCPDVLEAREAYNSKPAVK